MNRRIPNGTYGGVRGRGLVTPSYSIVWSVLFIVIRNHAFSPHTFHLEVSYYKV